jgi:hypothetical protein
MIKTIFEATVFASALALMYMMLMAGCAMSDRCSEAHGVHHVR